MNNKKRQAFTLAETLITLVVIGVVAALTVPALNAYWQKTQTIQRLKQVYSALNQSALMSIHTNGDMSDWDYTLTNEAFFNRYLDHFAKADKITIGDTLINYKRCDGKPETGLLVMRPGAKVVVLNSGIMIFTTAEMPTNHSVKRYCYAVDINGYEKPNKFGRDLFFFCVTGDTNHVTPHFYNDGESANAVKTRNELKDGKGSYNYQCNKSNGRGMWCAALIMTDNWQIKSDYPW